MRVKLGNTWYDQDNISIMMIELSDKDKENIANMLPECAKYCTYKSNTFTEDEVNAFMELTSERVALVDKKSVITDLHA